MPARKGKLLKQPAISAKERIEKSEDVTQTENAWSRGKPGELRPTATKRTAISVHMESPKKSDISTIHTHLIEKAGHGYSAPSIGDMLSFIAEIKKSNIRTLHVATINAKGEMIGYVSLHATPHAVELIIKKSYEPVLSLPGMFKVNDSTPDANRAALRRAKEALEKDGYSLHIKPMPGYEFKNWKFVKK